MKHRTAKKILKRVAHGEGDYTEGQIAKAKSIVERFARREQAKLEKPAEKVKPKPVVPKPEPVVVKPEPEKKVEEISKLPIALPEPAVTEKPKKKVVRKTPEKGEKPKTKKPVAKGTTKKPAAKKTTKKGTT